MTINYQNTPIHFDIHGEGSPVVLLHGFLEHRGIWNDFIPLLKKQHQVICIDLFGHGETPEHGAIHTMKTMADSVSEVMNHLDIGSAAIIGHSMGGYVTMALADEFSQKVSKLLLMNSTPKADSEKRKKERNQAIKIAPKHKEAFVRMAIRKLFSEKNRELFKAKLNQHIEDAGKMKAKDIIATVKGMKNRKDRTEVLKSFSGKKWIISGKEDTIIPFELTQEVAEITNAKLIALPDGHMSYIEQKEKIQKVLIAFLEN